MYRRSLFGLILAVCLPGAALANGDYVEWQAGLGQGGLLPPQGNYDTFQLSLALGQSLNDAISDKLNLEVPGEWSLRVMPWLSHVSAPDSNAELGCLLSLKIGYEVSDALMPYIAGGTGPMYTTQQTMEQSTQFNFASYGALGLQYRLDDESALGLEYWVRHFSNASIRDPNDGVDTTHWMLGYTLFTD